MILTVPYACIIIIPLTGPDGVFRKYLQMHGFYQIFNTRVPFSCFYIHTPPETRFSVGEWRQSMPRSAPAASPAVPEACGEGSGWGGASEWPNILSRKLKRAPAKSMSNLYSSLLPPPEGQRGQSVCLMRCFLSSRDSAEGARCRM